MEDNNHTGIILSLIIGLVILVACGLLAGLMIMLGVLIL